MLFRVTIMEVQPNGNTTPQRFEIEGENHSEAIISTLEQAAGDQLEKGVTLVAYAEELRANDEHNPDETNQLVFTKNAEGQWHTIFTEKSRRAWPEEEALLNLADHSAVSGSVTAIKRRHTGLPPEAILTKAQQEEARLQMQARLNSAKKEEACSEE